MCPQETRAGAGSWVLNHHGNLTRALLSGPGLPASQGPGSWTRSFPAAGQNPLQQSPSSQPPPPAQPTPFPLENLRPASERPVVTPPGCRPSATKGTVSGGQGRRQPGSLTQADLGGTGSAASRSGLAGRFPPGSGTHQPLPDLPFPAWQLLLTSCHPRAIPATLTHLLITELLVSQASGSGDRRGVRVLTHLIIPGARMELSLELQSWNASPAPWGPSPQHSPVNHARNSSFQSLPSGAGLNGDPRKICPHPNP